MTSQRHAAFARPASIHRVASLLLATALLVTIACGGNGGGDKTRYSVSLPARDGLKFVVLRLPYNEPGVKVTVRVRS